jgi:large subunit ribosomal protein L18
MAKTTRQQERNKRRQRTMHTIVGTMERPRLTVFRTTRHMTAQVIDDTSGKTLASVHSYKKGALGNATKTVCSELGKKLAADCLTKNITKVVFDKNGFTYHGRVQALADGAREGGLKF